MDKRVYEMRERGIKNSLKNGVHLSHRLKEMKLDESGTILLPDLLQEPDSGLCIGDCVEINPAHLVPWGSHLPCELEAYGLAYNTIRGTIMGPYEPKTHQILCFARVGTSTKRTKCRIEGVFVILGVRDDVPENPRALTLCTIPHLKKTVLYWIGCLKKIEVPTC